MTENEAVEIVKNFPDWNLDDQWLDESEMQELSEIIISILQEIQKYRTIGTVGECRAAREKQKPKIADIWGDGYADGNLVYDMYDCPNCGATYELGCDEYKYCPECGQAIDWS